MKSQKGSSMITTPVVVAIGIMLVSVLIVFVIKILMPYIWYEKLSATCIKYVFVMEEYGYLSKTEKQNLISELDDQGFDKTKLQVDATSKLQSYGSPIYINIKYDYDTGIPIENVETIKMEIKKSSVSKR